MRTIMLIWIGIIACMGQAGAYTPYNTALPIEITADSLEVLQNQQEAIFRGNVVAVQGDVKLRSNTMRVYYKDGVTGNTSAISKIEVQGNVFMATPDETAKGSNGQYNVDAKMIHLVGDVVLTKGQNVLKGTKLTYNLANGRSVVTGGASVKSGKSDDGRVKAIFVPKDAE